MQTSAPETTNAHNAVTGTVLRLLVRNHPGVMSHVCGLFARRGFNVEGILCLPVGDGSYSVVLLLVNEDERLGQMMCQLRKLEDVLDMHRAPEAHAAFAAAAGYMHDQRGFDCAARSTPPAARLPGSDTPATCAVRAHDQ